MCGRFTLRTSPAEVAAAFDLLREPEFEPRENICPTEPVPVVRRRNGVNELDHLRWGLVPSWAQELKVGVRMINARAETVASKPSFRAAFRRRRCLIVADGFYEWQKIDGRKRKQAWWIGLKSGEPFAFAGLWETWRSPHDEIIESCTIVTTEANALLAEIHDRMPVLLHRRDRGTWLTADADNERGADELQSLLVPLPASLMQRREVESPGSRQMSPL